MKCYLAAVIAAVVIVVTLVIALMQSDDGAPTLEDRAAKSEKTADAGTADEPVSPTTDDAKMVPPAAEVVVHKAAVKDEPPVDPPAEVVDRDTKTEKVAEPTEVSRAFVAEAVPVAWDPAVGPLMTRWAKDVSPDKALPEYPRPQMVRKQWLNLNGLWDYAIRPNGEAKPQTWDGTILVPFPVESALSGVMKPVGEKDRLWYRRVFKIPADWVGKRVLLHFGAVDWETTVWVNGKALGTHKGGYDGFSFDITDALKPDGAQDVVVSVWDPSDAGPQPRGKQTRKPGFIWYTATTGIWQTVWLEPVGEEAAIEALKIVPDVDEGALKLTVTTTGGEGLFVEAVALDDGNEIGCAVGRPDTEIVVPVRKPKLWSFDTPFLYDLKVTLRKDTGKTVDAVDSYFGMRKITIEADEKGVARIMLNGKFVLMVGPLDQGFWPDGIYTAPTDEALKFDVEVTRRLGFNVTRKHVKVEPERWYYWCDKLGLLVWQDMPNGNNNTAAGKQQFEKELEALIDGRFNHPSIIMWVLFNEGWGQHDTRRLTERVKQADPSRLVNSGSGMGSGSVGDVIDVHHYAPPVSPNPTAGRVAVLGEFGGLGLGVDDHTWTRKAWGYLGMSSNSALTRQYVGFVRRVYELMETPGLCGAIYTQITDVETECNGLLTYDREVVKVDVAVAADANRGVFPTRDRRVVVPTSEKEKQSWRYTPEKPTGEWTKPEYDASTWQEGEAGFGREGTPGATVRTEWKTDEIWLRREFTLPEGPLGNLELRLHHDEDAEVYINGVLAAKPKGYVTEYVTMEMDPKARAVIKPGRNMLAVYCRQTWGGQCIDVGIVEVIRKSLARP